MKIDGQLKNLETLKIEVSMVDTDKEGHLRGGFTALAAPSSMTGTNRECNYQCNFDCNNGCNFSCVNECKDTNNGCNSGCNLGCNVRCTNPTEPKDPIPPTDEESTSFMAFGGVSLLF